MLAQKCCLISQGSEVRRYGATEPELKSTASSHTYIYIYILAARIAHTPHCAPLFTLCSSQTLDAIAATLQGRPETRLLWRCGRPNWRVSIRLHIWQRGGSLAHSLSLPVSIRHGPKWEAFRQEVQHILLQPQTAKKYIPPLNDIASEFMVR